MESGERLPSSAASSTAPTSSSTPPVASAVSKGGLSTGAASLSSTVNPCGAEWWRTADIPTRTGATFFPPLLGIPPLFAPPAQNHDSSSFHSRTSGKSNRNGPEKGVNGSINGNSTSSVSGISTSVLSTTASSSTGQTKTVSSGGGNRKCNQEQSKSQPLDARADKIKDKKPRKKAMESSSNSDSDSGTSSDTSSEGISSSDSDDLEEDEEEEDQSIEESEDDDSDSESEAQHKSNNQVLLHGISDPKADGQKATEKAQEKRIHQPLPLVSESQTHSSFQSQQKQPQVLSQQLPFIFQSSQAKEESARHVARAASWHLRVAPTGPVSSSCGRWGSAASVGAVRFWLASPSACIPSRFWASELCVCGSELLQGQAGTLTGARHGCAASTWELGVRGKLHPGPVLEPVPGSPCGRARFGVSAQRQRPPSCKESPGPQRPRVRGDLRNPEEGH